MVTMTGSLLVGGGGGVLLPTRIRTPRLVVAAPWLSVARALKVNSPAGALLHTKNHKLELTIPGVLPACTPKPRLWSLAKNCTEATDPSVSRASAVIPIFAPAENVAPACGWIISTTGGR